MSLSRREFLSAAAAAPIALGDRRPQSTILIVADQLTWWMTDPAQRGPLALPAIDRLRAEGTVFERAYCTSPLCAPARVVLRTGLFPHANPGGRDLLADTPTVEQRLSARGVRTRYVGKWHLSPGQGTSSGYVLPRNRPHWDWFLGHEKSHTKLVTFLGNDPTPISTQPWDASVMTDYALRLLRSDAKSGEPFFMQLNYLAPHHPYNWYPFWLKAYSPSGVTARANVPAALSTAARNRLANYMNQVHGLDLEIARLLAEIDALGIDPVVVFTSDHGDMLYSHGEEYKRRPWEESARIPLVIRGPGWRRETIRHPVGLIDLPRTLAGLGQGMDLRDARDSVYLEITDPVTSWLDGTWRAVVTDDGWTLAVSENGTHLLHDLGSDPYELADLGGQGHPREGELLARMREWAAATGDDFFA